MATKPLGKISRSALMFSPIVIVFVGFFAVLYWLRPQSSTLVLVLTAAASLFVMGYANFLARRVQRRLDEVQIASQRFATFQSFVWGAGAAILLLQLPPVSNWLIDLTDVLTAGAADVTVRHRAAVLLGLNFGLMLLVLVQMACMLIASLVWNRRMGGTSEQP